jgi:hypothetical protein
MIFYNDTNKEYVIHPATAIHGIECDMSPIPPRTTRKFKAPKGIDPFVKVWEYDNSNTILVSAAFGEPLEEEVEESK